MLEDSERDLAHSCRHNDDKTTHVVNDKRYCLPRNEESNKFNHEPELQVRATAEQTITYNSRKTRQCQSHQTLAQ